MSSMGGRFTFAGVGAYSATKFALEGWSEALSKEVDRFGIRVLIVEPGAFQPRSFNGAGALLISEPIAAYDDQIAPLRTDMPQGDGKQPGDPTKAAAAILAALDRIGRRSGWCWETTPLTPWEPRSLAREPS